jgi:3-oxoacyl-[acyl-carrier protein] reductase
MSKRTILIVGASSAIGGELIRQIGDEDITIIAHYHSNRKELDELAKTVKASIVPIQADLSNGEGITSLIEAVGALCGHPDKIVLLAAPYLELIRFKDLEWNKVKLQVDMQVEAAFRILQKFLPPMGVARYGKIVFMLSSCTIGTPPANMLHYVTGKYALLGMMKSLAAEYAGKKVSINAVSPSMIETGFLAKMPEKIVEITAQQHPQKRNAIPADVAPTLKFLLSDEAGFITGVNIPITGGG